jgi:hypothetical protein
MIPLFGDSMADGRRFVLEGRLISVALQALRLGTSVVLDYGLWAAMSGQHCAGWHGRPAADAPALIGAFATVSGQPRTLEEARLGPTGSVRLTSCRLATV